MWLKGEYQPDKPNPPFWNTAATMATEAMSAIDPKRTQEKRIR
jgi:hypothetical protein